MDPNSPRDTPDDPRTGFVRSLPRKIVEIKATFGALIADPRSTRMRDELRRKLHALYTLARSYQLPRLAEALSACIDILDATRALPQLTRPHIDSLAGYVGSFTQCVEADTHDPAASPSSPPTGTREDASRAATVRISAARVGTRATLSPDLSAAAAEAVGSVEGRASTVPYRTLPPGTTLRKGVGAAAGHGPAVHVLFVGTSARANALHEALPAEVELLVTRTVTDAARRARDTAPDVVVAECSPQLDGAALVSALRADPVTEFVPVVLLAGLGEGVEALRERCADAAEVLPDATDGAAVWESIERALGVTLGESAGGPELGDVTLDELSRTLQEEIRRGLVGAATPRARGARIALGAGNEVLLAAWEAIARIRQVVERRSNGAVRFEVPSAPRGMAGALVVTLGDESAAGAEEGVDDPLTGRRVLVVDDDATVATRVAARLREAGAEVTATTSGQRALLVARQARPDLVVADLAMPELDGVGLCQALRRDPLLRHTPVLLVTWRDEVLARVREEGGASLSRDVGGDALVGRAKEALRQRVRLLTRVAGLTGTAEVRGRLERVGLVALLDATSRALGDATVTVSDPWSVAELHLREGRLVSALRTAHDGSLLRGEAALVPVLGATAARFTVTRSKGTVRENLTGPQLDVLTRCARKITALEESLKGAALLDVTRVDVDRDAALTYARTLPPRMGAIVERIADGEAPRDLVLRDAMAPSDLEPLLIELARRGAVHRVLDVRGDDLTALRLSSVESTAPPPDLVETRPVPISLAGPTRPVPVATPQPPRDEHPPAATASSSERADSLADAVWRELRDSVHDEPFLRRKSPMPYPAATGRAPSQPPAAKPAEELPPLPELGDDLGTRTPASPTSAKLLRASRPDAAADLQVAETRRIDDVPPPPAARESSPLLDLHAIDAAEVHTRELPDGVLDMLRGGGDDDEPAAPISLVPPAAKASPRAPTPPATPPSAVRSVPPPTPPAATRAATPPPPATRSSSPATRSSSPAALASTAPRERQLTPDGARRPPTPPPQALATRSPARTTGEHPPTSDTPPAAARSVGPVPRRDDRALPLRPALLVLGVGAAFAGSYYGVRWYLSHASPPDTVVVTDSASTPAAVTAPHDESDGAALDPAPASPPPSPSSATAATHAVMAPREDRVVTEYRDTGAWLDGATLPPRAGMLVLAAENAGDVRAQIDGREATVGPFHTTLPEGMHAVRLIVSGRTRYELATVRGGQALVLHVTPEPSPR